MLRTTGKEIVIYFRLNKTGIQGWLQEEPHTLLWLLPLSLLLLPVQLPYLSYHERNKGQGEVASTGIILSLWRDGANWTQKDKVQVKHW